MSGKGLVFHDGHLLSEIKKEDVDQSVILVSLRDEQSL